MLLLVYGTLNFRPRPPSRIKTSWSLEAGSITELDADNARLVKLQAEIGLLQERTNRDLAAVQLRQAMGDY